MYEFWRHRAVTGPTWRVWLASLASRAAPTPAGDGRAAILAVVGLFAAVVTASAEVVEVAWRVPVTTTAVAPVQLDHAGLIVYAASPQRILFADAAAGFEIASVTLDTAVVLLAAAGDVGLAVLADGQLWSLNPDDPVELDCLPANPETAIWTGSRLVIQFADGGLVGLAPSGAILWRVFDAAPARLTALAGELLALVQSNGVVEVRAASDGARRLESAVEPGVVTAPAVVGRTLVLGSPGQRVIAVDLARGKRRWRADAGFGPSADLLSLDDVVLIASHANQLIALAEDGNPRFRLPLPARVVAPLARWRQWILFTPHRRPQLYSLDPSRQHMAILFEVSSRLAWLEGGPTVLGDRIAVFVRQGSRRELVVLAPPAPRPTSTLPEATPTREN